MYLQRCASTFDRFVEILCPNVLCYYQSRHRIHEHWSIIHIPYNRQQVAVTIEFWKTNIRIVTLSEPAGARSANDMWASIVPSKTERTELRQAEPMSWGRFKGLYLVRLSCILYDYKQSSLWLKVALLLNPSEIISSTVPSKTGNRAPTSQSPRS